MPSSTASSNRNTSVAPFRSPPLLEAAYDAPSASEMKPHARPVPSLVLEDIEAARSLLGDRVITTPIREWQGPAVIEAVGPGTRVFLKLELFQRTGSFKVRGA